MLHASPVYYGCGVPRGDGSAVVLIPGFLCSDAHLMPMHCWLERIGYTAFYSGLGINADCPNLLIQQQLTQRIEETLQYTGRKIHLIGHSLGGIIARSIAAQRPKDIASVITLGAPFRRVAAHRSILRVAEEVRLRIIEEHGDRVLPDCYSGRCTCDFLKSVRRCMPASVLQTSIYTKDDGVVDWRCCSTSDCSSDFIVHGTHVGLAFNPAVYEIIGTRLAARGDT
ncbi:MAG TPA: alpha/beta fold hydrolase [Candidatus Sulfotelmatobacter sp.]|nr:alpha/beta fold hydrolase [Candidatus Sulfotelmatobacter sp.]